MMLFKQACLPQQMLSRGGRQAKPTKEDRSKWDSDECARAKASQLSVARSDTAPTLLMTCK